MVVCVCVSEEAGWGKRFPGDHLDWHVLSMLAPPLLLACVLLLTDCSTMKLCCHGVCGVQGCMILPSFTCNIHTILHRFPLLLTNLAGLLKCQI